MAEALARGFLAQGVTSEGKLSCTDPNSARREVFESFGVKPCSASLEVGGLYSITSNCLVFHALKLLTRHALLTVQVVKDSEIIFIAVKPQYVATVLKEVSHELTDKHVIVSIAAGVTVAQMEEAAGPNAKIIRVMPNTPCLVSATAAAMCRGAKVTTYAAKTFRVCAWATADDGEAVRKLMSAVGTIVECDEKLFNAVTALSGSGPAYVFVMIEALADGAVAAGLPRDIAMQLAAQTVFGSAKMYAPVIADWLPVGAGCRDWKAPGSTQGCCLLASR
eukprot:scaffold346223_cov50-Prasinocladus_malaysianus.AAC.1